MRDSWRLPVLSGFLTALCLATAWAAGTIKQSGANIATGDAPQKGSVTIDANAARVQPTLPAALVMPDLGSMTGSIGSVSDGTGGAAFDATTDQTLAAGTYDVASYTIEKTATVTYQGAVTIRSKGDVNIYGHLRTTAAGANVKIISSGRVEMWGMGGQTPEGIHTTGSGADIEIDAGTIVSDIGPAGTNRSSIKSDAGKVTLTSHDVGMPLSLIHLDVEGSGDVTVRSAGSIDIWTVTITSPKDVLVQSFSGGIQTNASTISSSSGAVLVEGSRGVNLINGSVVHAQGDVTVKSFGSGAGQEVTVNDSTISAFRDTGGGNGTLTVVSSAGVVVKSGGSIEHDGTGDLVVAATGGSVSLESPGATTGGDIVHGNDGGNVVVLAKGDVNIAGASQIQTKSSSARLQVGADGTLVMADTGKINGAGAVDVRGSRVSASVGSSAGPVVQGATVSISGGGGGLDLRFGSFDPGAGGASLVATGPVVLRGSFVSDGQLTVQSTGGNIDVASATLRTADGGGKASGSITVATFLATGTIDATGSTIRTGSSSKSSGDVTLAVVTQAMVGGGTTDVDGYLLPKKITVKPAPGNPSLSVLRASGVIDTGSATIDLSGDSVVTVGTTSLELSLTAVGRKLVHKESGVSLQIVPKLGTSKSTFSLVTTGDFSSWLDSSGSGILTLTVQHGTFTVSSTVRVSGGRFTLGRTRGAMTEPTLYVKTARATLKSATTDSLDLTLGFTTDGTTPASPPDVTVSFGTSWTATIPSTEFQVKGGAFVAKDPTTGVTVIVNYPAETITVRARRVELGAPAADETISVVLGTETRSVAIRMAQRGAVLAY